MQFENIDDSIELVEDKSRNESIEKRAERFKLNYKGQ